MDFGFGGLSPEHSGVRRIGFSTEEACRAYLEQLRWPDGFCCPHCQGRRAVRVHVTLLQCCTCRRQTLHTDCRSRKLRPRV
ncbi:MAG: transposase [Bryobacteraceae bacterium]